MGKLTYSEIMEDMQRAKEELDIATRSFESADTDELVDIWTLQIAVARKKCDYLIKMAKEQGFMAEDTLTDNVSAAL